MNTKKGIADAASALMGVVGAILVVAALGPFLNPRLATLHTGDNSAGNGPIIAIVLLITVGVLMMAGGLKLGNVGNVGSRLQVTWGHVSRFKN